MTKLTELPFAKNNFRKRKVTSTSKLDKNLWKEFSLFTRIRDADENGIASCISCGKIVQVWFLDGRFNNQVHAGHFYNTGGHSQSLKYEEKNVNAQCYDCNMRKEGNKQGYEKGLVKKYGPEVLDFLEIKKSLRSPWSTSEYEILIKLYRGKVRQMKIDRGLSF